MPDALDIGIAIFLIGLIIGLPNIDTILFDFTSLGTSSINLMRLGLTAVFIYFLTGGRNA